MHRSRSLDLSNVSRGSYLSRWSRENTPIDSGDNYGRQIRRSFTPVRDISSYQPVHDYRRRAFSEDRYGFHRDPVGIVTTPYHTNYGHYYESQPVRKYDVFQVRTWSYPIYKYLYGRDQHHDRPYSYTRQYANKSLYTPPLMTPECNSATARRGYSGYNFVGGDSSYNFSSRPWSQSTYKTLRTTHVSNAAWYWNGRSNLRHYNSYRPTPYSSTLSTYWKSYF